MSAWVYDRFGPVVSSISTPFNGCRASSALRHRPDIQFAVDQARAGTSALIQALLGPHFDRLDEVRVLTPNLRRRPACQPVKPVRLAAASGLTPYCGLYRVLSAPAYWEPLGAILGQPASMCERKLSLPSNARSPLPGPPFSPFGWPGSRTTRLHQLLSVWRMFQTGSSEDVNVAPLRILGCSVVVIGVLFHLVSPAHR
jgi:hypothetical protein